ncbi:MAG: SEL1-like repeat protein [Proteobacteria bacterium]|nr:SEL1-like repeat protein [Pseudomonadota bacterium]
MKINPIFKLLGGCSALLLLIGLPGCSSNRAPAPISEANPVAAPASSFASSPVCSSNPFLQKYHCSFTRIEEAAREGNPDAQYALGYLYYRGIGTTQDRQTGLLWIRRAAAQGQPVAQQALKTLSGTRTAPANKTPAAVQNTTTNVPPSAAPATGAAGSTQNVAPASSSGTNNEKPLTDLLPNYGEKRVDATEAPPAVNLSAPPTGQ